MTRYVYHMSEVKKSRTGAKSPILDGISLSFLPGAKIGVVGGNGAGKSTLLRIMAGVDTPSSGEAKPAEGIRIGFLAQEPELDDQRTVLENISDGIAEARAIREKYDQLATNYSDETANEMAELQERIDALGLWDLDAKLNMAMDALNCPPPEAQAKNLSGGERRRTALCRLLLSSPDMLLLDEPTNHLDAETVAWLETYLRDYPGAALIVTHDRYFLNNIVAWILEIDRGKGIPFEGPYEEWLEERAKRLEREEKSEQAKQRGLRRELEWLKRTPEARRSKSQSRIRAYDEAMRQDVRKLLHQAQIVIPPGERIGDAAVKAENATKIRDGRTLFKNLSFILPAGGIVGIFGANGEGKTTLLKTILGEEHLDQGNITLGTGVTPAYASQERGGLPDNLPAWKAIANQGEVVKLAGVEIPARQYAARFGFKGERQIAHVKDLSGGERNRLHLAVALRSGANLLLLDEPTNDLDVETLRALEEALVDFAGCAFVVSHDRMFLDRIATHMIAFEGNGKTVWLEGGFSDYENDLIKRIGSDTEVPAKARRRRFSRN